MVKHSVMMINAFPPNSGINTHLSPHNIVVRKSLSYKHHFKMPLGDYAQVHKEEQAQNSNVDNTICNIKEMNGNDETPMKRNRHAPKNYTPSFKNKTYALIEKGNIKDAIIEDEITLVQVLQKVFQQMSLKEGIKKFGDQATEGLPKELRQMHLHNSFIPCNKNTISQEQWKNQCEAVNLKKEKVMEP